MKTDKKVLDIVLHHGWFSGRKSGGKINNMIDALAYWNCDILAVGHAHERLIAPPQVQVEIRSKMKQFARRRFAVMCGSYLRNYDTVGGGYAEDKGYRPTDMGHIKLSFRPETQKITGSI